MGCIECNAQFRLVRKVYKYIKLPFKRTICVSIYMCPNHHVYAPIAIWEPIYKGMLGGKPKYEARVHKEEELTEEEIEVRKKQEPATIIVKRGGCQECTHIKSSHAMGYLECHESGCKCQHFKSKKTEEVTV